MRSRPSMTLPLRCAALALLACGCSTAVEVCESTEPLKPGTYTELGEAEGANMAFSFLLFEFGRFDTAGAAREEAIRNANADALVKVSVDQSDFYFLFLFGFHRTIVHGIAVQKM